jgi:hypothetical protein
MNVKVAIKINQKATTNFRFRFKWKRIKTLTKWWKSKEQKQKKTIHYKLWLKNETKNKGIFVKDTMKK